MTTQVPIYRAPHAYRGTPPKKHTNREYKTIDAVGRSIIYLQNFKGIEQFGIPFEHRHAAEKRRFVQHYLDHTNETIPPVVLAYGQKVGMIKLPFN